MRVTGFSVSSNSTGVMHTEQVLDVGGGLSLATTGVKPTVTNGSKLALQDVSVVRRKLDGNTEIARLGSLAPGGTATADFIGFTPQTAAGSILLEQRSALDNRDELWSKGFVLAELTTLLVPRGATATGPVATPLQPGETCLFAWTPETLTGVTADPDASQKKRATLLIAHLTYPTWPEARPDKSAKPFGKDVPSPNDPVDLKD